MIGRIILVLVLLSIITISGFFTYRLYFKFDTEKKLKTLVPLIGTTSLPEGKLQEKYNAYVYASVVGINRQMKIEVESLPSGLTLENCTTQYNVKGPPKPNSIIGCFIQGIPDKPGGYDVVVRVIADDFILSNYVNLPLVVNGLPD